jgi:phytoene desaturase (3,4-didehydrolycopene-forming)
MSSHLIFDVLYDNKGMDSILVLVPCQTLARNEQLASLPRDEAIEAYRQQFTDEYIATVRTAVVQRMKVIISDINSVILHEVVDTPATYADMYNVGAGTPFGLSHGLGQLSVFRPTGRSSNSPRLPTFTKGNDDDTTILYCGASTRPGNGVPLVLVGAKQVAVKALQRIKRRKDIEKI